MSREIKFRATWEKRNYEVATMKPHHKSQGYVFRKVNEHPFMTNRGYVREQRLVIEEHLGRFLQKNEFVHHIDGNRENNDLTNLKLYDGQSTHATSHLNGKRNPNGRFLASEPIFEMIKFRLLNTNTGNTEVYTLSELIGKTYRRGQFKFRGRNTGLKDKNGKEIYEADILSDGDHGKTVVRWDNEKGFWDTTDGGLYFLLKKISLEVIGDIYSNPDLLKES